MDMVNIVLAEDTAPTAEILMENLTLETGTLMEEAVAVEDRICTPHQYDLAATAVQALSLLGYLRKIMRHSALA
jgi:hypothetical protein